MARAAITLVAEWRTRRAGFAVLKIGRRGSASLDAIAVTELARGHGVGRSLLRAVEREASGHGARTLELVTAEANVAGLGLFLRGGYAMVKRLMRYYPRGQHAQLLRKRLV